MAKEARRRARSPHPGVKLKRRALAGGGVSYRAHYLDPQLGKEVAVTVPAKVTTREGRLRWAKDLSARLARQRHTTTPLDGGAVPLGEAVASFVERPRTRERTQATHAAALGKLLEWARRERVRTTAELTRAKLAKLRDEITRATKRAPVVGGSVGEKVATSELRSPFTANRELASIRAALNFWRARGELPLGRDEILDALALVELPRDEPDYLAPAAIRKLLAAALRHDAARYYATRAEHAGEAPAGSTPKHVPIAPAVLLVLLTGMRRGEALALRWEHVDLDALDHQGRAVGEIRLTAAMTKTKRGRTIGLEVSPALRRLLATLRLRHGGEGYVLGGAMPYTPEIFRASAERIVSMYGAPVWTWQLLRSTAATFLTNAPGVFGSASVFLSARQLGHSVAVAERHYLNTIRGIPREARTLEDAMQCEKKVDAVLAAVLEAPAVERRRRRVKVRS